MGFFTTNTQEGARRGVRRKGEEGGSNGARGSRGTGERRRFSFTACRKKDVRNEDCSHNVIENKGAGIVMLRKRPFPLSIKHIQVEAMRGEHFCKRSQ